MFSGLMLAILLETYIGVGDGARESDGAIGERGGSGEPVGRSDASIEGKGDSGGAGSETSPDESEKAKGSGLPYTQAVTATLFVCIGATKVAH